MRNANGLSFGPLFAEADLSWPLEPAAGDEHAILVLGRARRDLGNACVSVAADLAGAGDALEWALSPSGWKVRGREVVPLAAALGAGVWEFQPGPVVDGARVLVAARQWDEIDPPRVDERRTKAWVLALDLASGGVIWKRRLA